MRFKSIRRVFGLFILVISLLILIWGLYPVKYQSRSIQLDSADMVPPEMEGLTTGAVDPETLAPEPRELTLEWPDRLPAGDLGQVRLTLKPSHSQQGSTNDQPVEAPGSQIETGSDETYDLILQARLDLPGVTHTPTGEISQLIPPGRAVAVLWNLRPQKSGLFGGKIWLHLRVAPRDGAEGARMLLTAQQVEVETTRLFGLSGDQARGIGSLGVALGAYLGLDRALLWCFEKLRKLIIGQVE